MVYIPSFNDYQLAKDGAEGSSFKVQGPQMGSHKDVSIGNDDIDITCELHWESTGGVFEEKQPVYLEILIIDRHLERPSYPEYAILEASAEIMKCTILSVEEPKAGYLYRCQRHSIYDICGFQALFRIMESLGDVDLHQRKRIVNCIVDTPAPKFFWSFSSSIIGQYYDFGLRQKIWGNEFSRITGDLRTDMKPLLGNQYPSSSYICTNYDESSACIKQTHCTDGVVAIRPSVQTDHEPVWDTQFQPIFIEYEQKLGEVLKLIPRQQIY
ncbi:hypothetical protein AYI69_g9878 [Smittium culicis]|uniref:Uncharacterized protein n=1 Tax=Smittium culicis TaxID=133412 RepID=A0A1R1X9N0_9FUNG|nr:hypothetical protein AYI69_g9878 [Smittium culicis]